MSDTLPGIATSSSEQNSANIIARTLYLLNLFWLNRILPIQLWTAGRCKIRVAHASSGSTAAGLPIVFSSFVGR